MIHSGRYGITAILGKSVGMHGTSFLLKFVRSIHGAYVFFREFMCEVCYTCMLHGCEMWIIKKSMTDGAIIELLSER